MENQSGTNSNLASAVIKELLQREGVTKILSARIGGELNEHKINYRDGGVKLKQYLQTNVPGLKLIEKIGLNEFWGFDSDGESNQLNSNLQMLGNPWKEIASPNSSETVAWSESERRWLIVPPEMPPATDHWIIDSVSKAELTKIANEFADKYESTLIASPELLAAIRRNEVGWYQQLIKNYAALKANWSEIRISGIMKVIRERLEQARINEKALSESDLEAAILAMDSIREKASQSRKIDSRAEHRFPTSLREEYHSRNGIRELAMRAISNMGENDIRKIWLPLGSIFDVIS